MSTKFLLYFLRNRYKNGGEYLKMFHYKSFIKSIIKALQKDLCKNFAKRLHVLHMFLKEHVGTFNDTLIGCFVYFQNVIG